MFAFSSLFPYANFTLTAVSQYEYDNFGRLIKTIYPNDSVKQKFYDQAGRLIQTMDEEGQSEQFSYDRNSNLVYRVDREGQTFTYDYNSRNLPTQITGTNEHGSSVKTYTYNAAGQLLTASVDGKTYSYTYHQDDGTLTKVTYPDSRSTTINQYEAESRIEITDPFDQQIHFLFDTKLNTYLDVPGTYIR